MESKMSDENGKSGNQGLVVVCILLEGIRLVRGGDDDKSCSRGKFLLSQEMTLF